MFYYTSAQNHETKSYAYIYIYVYNNITYNVQKNYKKK